MAKKQKLYKKTKNIFKKSKKYLFTKMQFLLGQWRQLSF